MGLGALLRVGTACHHETRPLRVAAGIGRRGLTGLATDHCPLAIPCGNRLLPSIAIIDATGTSGADGTTGACATIGCRESSAQTGCARCPRKFAVEVPDETVRGRNGSG
jgi:hypothetical protein